jgi:hypothetical protein
MMENIPIHIPYGSILPVPRTQLLVYLHTVYGQFQEYLAFVQGNSAKSR